MRNDGYAAQLHYDSLDGSDDGAWNGSFRFAERTPSADNYGRKEGCGDRRGHANGNTEEMSGY